MGLRILKFPLKFGRIAVCEILLKILLKIFFLMCYVNFQM